jgi:NAD(P)-dependent dehydrogenase (short-subunit alcohol dehydrogenase family)
MADGASLFDLTGETALVTGASQGLGAGCALALAKAGADVVLVARTPEPLEGVAAEVRAFGRKAYVLACDVTSIPEPFTAVTEDHFDTIMNINVRAAFFVAQAVAARMIEKGIKGSIIQMSSQMGHIGAVNRAVYCTSKHAIEGLTKAMAVELAPSGIRVNTVAPTFIETPLTKPFLEDAAFMDLVLKQIPLGHIGQIDDVTGAVVYLASPAARMVTGSCIKVDGGWTAH